MRSGRAAVVFAAVMALSACGLLVDPVGSLTRNYDASTEDAPVLVDAAVAESANGDGAADATRDADASVSADAPLDADAATDAMRDADGGPPPFATIRIACGQLASLSAGGKTWTLDHDYDGGIGYITTPTVPVAGTDASTLYNGQRFGQMGVDTPTPFSYVFPSLPPGSYDVTMKFTENFAAEAGQRVFNVDIDGITVLDNFDIFAATGGQWIALDEAFSVGLPDGGTIVVQFLPGLANSPKVDAIEIAREGDGG